MVYTHQILVKIISLQNLHLFLEISLLELIQNSQFRTSKNSSQVEWLYRLHWYIVSSCFSKNNYREQNKI